MWISGNCDHFDDVGGRAMSQILVLNGRNDVTQLIVPDDTVRITEGHTIVINYDTLMDAIQEHVMRQYDIRIDT